MLATECARVLNYRDSYLLFNKNRSLHKIIASQIEKDDLIQQDILPYSYRSRQIAIVSARSMFRQFGSRVVANGRRVRDDYWESKARKQGFTEDDMAGEKRPGAAKTRDGANTDPERHNTLPALPHNDVIFSSVVEALPPGLSLDVTDSSALAQLPMIHMSTTDDHRLREYMSQQQSRQELTGQPYQDRTQTSTGAEIIHQAQTAADFNRALGAQRNLRLKGLDEFYNKPREAPETDQPQSNTTLESGLCITASPSKPSSSSRHVKPCSSTACDVSTSIYGSSTSLPSASTPTIHRAITRSRHASGDASRSYASTLEPIYARRGGSTYLRISFTTATAANVGSTSAATTAVTHVFRAGRCNASIRTANGYTPAGAITNSPCSTAPPIPSQSTSTICTPDAATISDATSASSATSHGPDGLPWRCSSWVPRHAARMYPSTQGPGGQPFMGAPQQHAGMPVNMGTSGGMPGWPAGPGGPMQPGQPQPGQSGSPLGGWSGY